METVRRSVSASSVTEPFKGPRAPTASEPTRSPVSAKTRKVSPSSSHRASDARSKGTSERICSLASSKTSSMLRPVLTAATMRLTVSDCWFASPRYSTSARSRSSSGSGRPRPPSPSAVCSLSSGMGVSALLLVALDDAERGGEEVELLAQAVLEEALEREVEARPPARGEDDEGGRAHADLRQVLDVQARLPALHGRGRRRRAARRDDALVEGVELRGRDAPVARLVGAQGEREEALDALALQGGDGDDRRPFEELHLEAQVALERGGRAGLLVGDGVPLVDGEDDRAARVERVAGDVGVERRHALDGVDDDDRHVGALQAPARHQDRQLLGHLLGLALAADARGVDEAEGVPVGLEDGVNRVARRARDGRDDDALLADELVEQRRLPDVRAAHDGEPDLARRFFRLSVRRLL